ncbi:hypothetical protein E2C01_020516 [Portunus trituberculatus]|uniref:Uncharacterized protein n=1 Tax=Portunus trituberculatus TaxID=210409 RepID=A0A5B7E1X4_PORTR|nr:hypothetical protein [Portunus trituberculatus]
MYVKGKEQIAFLDKVSKMLPVLRVSVVQAGTRGVTPVAAAVVSSSWFVLVETVVSLQAREQVIGGVTGLGAQVHGAHQVWPTGGVADGIVATMPDRAVVGGNVAVMPHRSVDVGLPAEVSDRGVVGGNVAVMPHRGVDFGLSAEVPDRGVVERGVAAKSPRMHRSVTHTAVRSPLAVKTGALVIRPFIVKPSSVMVTGVCLRCHQCRH